MNESTFSAAADSDYVGSYVDDPFQLLASTSLMDDLNSTSNDPSLPLPRPIFDAIDLYVTPVWYVLGVPGNVLAFVVWVQRRMRPSSGCYLAALALDECIFLVMQIFFELQTKWEITLLVLPGLCEAFPVLFMTAQYLSPLLVLAFTTDRYVSVCHPFHQDRFCCRRRPMTMIGLLTAGTLAMNAVQAYFWHYDAVENECGLRDEVMDTGISSLWAVWSWVTELLVFGVVPLIILILNILVIVETRRLLNEQKKFVVTVRLIPGGTKTANGDKSQQEDSTDKKKKPSSTSPSATTFMLLAVSFYLIATTLPVTIMYVMVLSFPEGAPMDMESKLHDPVWLRHRVYYSMRTVIDEIGLSHYASNFYIYLLTGQVFRRELRRLFATVLGRFVPDNSDYVTDGRAFTSTRC